MRKQIEKILDKHDDPAQVCVAFQEAPALIPKNELFWHTLSIRDKDISEAGIRRSHSFKKYIIGRLLDFAGKSDAFEDILEVLKKA